MDVDVLEFLLELLNRTTLSAAEPNFEQAAALVVKTRNQLTIELEKEHAGQAA